MAEKKVFDLVSKMNDAGSPVVPSPTSTGVITSLTEIEQGNSDIQRIGDKCTGTSLRFAFTCYPESQSATPSPDKFALPLYMLRVIIFIWKDDTDPTVAEVLDVQDSTANTSLLNPLNHDRKVKRKILCDEFFRASAVFDAGGTSGAWQLFGGWNTPIIFNKTMDLTKLKGGLNVINFSAGSTTGVNKVYALFISNSTIDGTTRTNWTLNLQSRYSFIDM